MVNSTRPRRSRNHQAAKPHKDFPLTAHPSGRWCKKVKGKIHFFGKIVPSDSGQSAQAALDKWLAEKDDLLAGRVPRARQADNGPTLRELVNRFLTAKATLRDAGELSVHTWQDYHNVSEHLVKAFGKERLLSDILPDDFEKLRSKWATRWGPVRVGNTINKARVVFNFAFKTRMIPAPMFYGEGFKRPSRKVLRLARAEKGIRMFEADELRSTIDAAPQPMKSMLLLAINCALGNSDVGNMRLKHLDLESGWMTYPRGKTGIMRRCPLWKETIEAIREWTKERQTPKNETDADLVFVTVKGGSWAKETSDNPVSKETRKLLDKLKIGGNRNFYAIRHTFETVAGESRDQVAVNAVMGHDDGSMASAYRERISDERLVAVAEHVRQWLFAEPEADMEETPRLRIMAEPKGDEEKEGVA